MEELGTVKWGGSYLRDLDTCPGLALRQLKQILPSLSSPCPAPGPALSINGLFDQKPRSYACASSPPTPATTSPLHWKVPRSFLSASAPPHRRIKAHCLHIHHVPSEALPVLFLSVLYAPVTPEFSRCKPTHFKSLLPVLHWLLVTLRRAY